MNLKEFKELINRIPDSFEGEDVDVILDSRLNHICIEVTSTVSCGVPYPAVKIRQKKSLTEPSLVIDSQFGWPIDEVQL